MTLPPPVVVNTMFLVVLSLIALFGLRRMRRIEDVARDKDDTLRKIEGVVQRILATLEKPQVVQTDDTALLNAIGEVKRGIEGVGQDMSQDFIVDTTLWFEDEKGYAKPLEFPFLPKVDETACLRLGSGDDSRCNFVRVDVLGVNHEEGGSPSIECFASGPSSRHRERLLSGGWTQIDSEEVGDVPGSYRRDGDGQGLQGIPGRS